MDAAAGSIIEAIALRIDSIVIELNYQTGAQLQTFCGTARQAANQNLPLIYADVRRIAISKPEGRNYWAQHVSAGWAEIKPESRRDGINSSRPEKNLTDSSTAAPGCVFIDEASRAERLTRTFNYTRPLA